MEVIEKAAPASETLNLKPSSLYDAILRKVEQLHGDFGASAIKSGFVAKYCNRSTKVAIVRVRHGPHRLVTSCLPLIDAIDGKSAHLDTLYTGATIRQCFKFILRHQQAKVDRFCAGLKTVEEKVAFKEASMNMDFVLKIN